MNMNNNNGGLGSLITTILQAIVVGIIALYAKRSSFFRPVYWAVVQLGAVLVGTIITAVLYGIFCIFGLRENSFVEMFCIGVWGLVSLGSISEIHTTMEQVEQEMFGDVAQLNIVQKILGFIYGLILHGLFLNEVGGGL